MAPTKKPSQAGKFKPVKRPVPIKTTITAAPTISASALDSMSPHFSNSGSKSSRRRQQSGRGSGSGGVRRGVSQSPNSPRKRQRRRKGKGMKQQKKQQHQHQQQQQSRVPQVEAVVHNRKAGATGDRGLGGRFQFPKGAPFFTGHDVAIQSNNTFDPSSPEEKESAPIVANIAITTSEQLLSNSSPQYHDCSPPHKSTSGKASLSMTAEEEGQQRFSEPSAPSNNSRDDYSIAIHEIIYGSKGVAHLKNHALQAEEVQKEEEEEEEKDEIVSGNIMVALPSDDDYNDDDDENHSLANNPRIDYDTKEECAHNFASNDSDIPSRNEDGYEDVDDGDKRDEDDCNSVVSDKAYYKDLCARLTFALEERKSAHRECKQEMRRIKREYSQLRQRFLDFQSVPSRVES